MDSGFWGLIGFGYGCGVGAGYGARYGVRLAGGVGVGKKEGRTLLVRSYRRGCDLI